ncbi:hypothetical protein FJ434_20915 [Mesorhizobium sp. B2-5-13]|uniref:hypothetical protein n=1 Tax=unclassified Mesorhizobium TaxID=325217 RepID=UPI001128129A|nr:MULTISPECIES: hypothetical protein [unclassified Mesorhizobium]TPJ81951.1 hypothetical protein FJ434_20915 [Mesorhizobium sp. B2-5-13]TPK45888.1 hypothetical protein FJ560_20130 [Mesorhizobium sp. B2-5-5]
MRIVVIVASLVAIVAIGITFLFRTLQPNPPAPAGVVEAPRQYDTTGGQQMRPRWDSSGGQGDDAAGN